MHRSLTFIMKGSLKIKEGALFSLEDVEAKINENRKRELKNLQARAKPLHELVITQEFVVTNITSQSYATSITPISEVMIEGLSPKYSGGFRVQTVLDVQPTAYGVPVRTILFSGYTPVRSGELVRVSMPCYEKLKPSLSYDDTQEYYVPRALTKLEQALEIVIVYGGHDVRTDRSTLHGMFAKPQQTQKERTDDED